MIYILSLEENYYITKDLNKSHKMYIYLLLNRVLHVPNVTVKELYDRYESVYYILTQIKKHYVLFLKLYALF